MFWTVNVSTTVLVYLLHNFAIYKICLSLEKFEDTKGVIRNNQSKDRRNNGQKFEDTKGVIIKNQSKDRRNNGQNKREKKHNL